MEQPVDHLNDQNMYDVYCPSCGWSFTIPKEVLGEARCSYCESVYPLQKIID